MEDESEFLFELKDKIIDKDITLKYWNTVDYFDIFVSPLLKKWPELILLWIKDVTYLRYNPELDVMHVLDYDNIYVWFLCMRSATKFIFVFSFLL